MTIKGIARSNTFHFESAHTDLQLAIESDRTEQVLAILKNGDLITRPLPNGHMPLHFAIRRGKFELVKALLKEVNVDLKSKDSQGLSAVDHAMIGNDLKMIELILGQMIGRELKAVLSWKMGVAHRAQAMELINEVGRLSSKEPFNELPELHRAARAGDLAEVQKYLNFKDKDPYDIYGMTPLHHAALAGKLEVVQWFIEKGGSKSDVWTHTGCSLLHLASIGGHGELISFLIKTHRMNPNAQDMQGRSPLHYAMVLEDLSAAKVLIQNGADPMMQTSFDLVPPLQAAFHSAKSRSNDRDHLQLRFTDCLMFAGILGTWASRLCGGSQTSLYLADGAFAFGAFLTTIDHLSFNAYRAFLSNLAASYYGARYHFGQDPQFHLETRYKIDWNGDTMPRMFLAFNAAHSMTTGYQVAKNAIQGLISSWKNRSIETRRPIRNAIVHSVIAFHNAYRTAGSLSSLYEKNKILNAWDEYMEAERDSFQKNPRLILNAFFKN